MNTTRSRAMRLSQLAAASQTWERTNDVCPPPRVRIMRVIDALDGASINDIAAADGAAQPSTTHHVNYLVEHGLAHRHPTRDGRSHTITLSCEGRAYLQQCEERMPTPPDPWTPLTDTERVTVEQAAIILERHLSRLHRAAATGEAADVPA